MVALVGIFRPPQTAGSRQGAERPKLVLCQMTFLGYAELSSRRALIGGRSSRTEDSNTDMLSLPSPTSDLNVGSSWTAAGEENGSPLDARLQAQCYQVCFDQFARLPQMAGMFWWKWPSHGCGSPFELVRRTAGPLSAAQS